MALDSVAKRLNELAETDSPLQRSRAMAQLWGDIRTTSPDDRRHLAHVLADRFAPALVERFETIAGIEGPEFIKLVRDLIDLDADDIRAVISDLGEAVEGPLPRPDDAEPSEVDTIERPSDLLTDAGSETFMRPHADDIEALLDDDVEASSLAQAVEALDQLPGSEPTPSAFDSARERLRRLEQDDFGDAEPDTGLDTESAPEAAPDVRQPLEVVREPSAALTPQTGATSQLESRLASTSDGWRRRRMLSAAIRRGEVDTSTALELSEMLSNRLDRDWIAGDLIEAGVAESERDLFRDRGLSSHLLRRLDRRAERRETPDSG